MSDDNRLSTTDPIVNEAIKRFRRCVEWENPSRRNFLEDLKFAEADSDNGFQWPNAIRRNRDIDERPCLTINKTRVHNLQITNDMRQNKPGLVARAVGGGASAEAAQMLTGIMRHIEYISQAQSAYTIAAGFQVRAGIGWLRVKRDYAGDDTFDQEIYIDGIIDPLAVYCDPDAKKLDKSDANFMFIFDDMPRDTFKEMYPEFKDMAGQNALGAAEGRWVTKDHIRVCEYFRRVEHEDQIIAFRDPHDGMLKPIRKSKLPKEVWTQIDADPMARKRSIQLTKVERHLIVGYELAETTEEPGIYIPLVPVIGEETVIDGILDRKGHTRALKDAQRMYNYHTSAMVEHLALQTKTPWIASAQAIEEYEGYWNTANKINYSVLTYNAYDDMGNVLPPPSRTEPPKESSGYIVAMQNAANELMMVSGQYQPVMGEPSNERSGKALSARQGQGDNATYHYIDNFAVALRHVGKILLDLIPRVYDTQRVMQIMAEDGTSFELEVDPQAKQAYEQRLDHEGEVAKRIFNPTVGKFDVEAEVGPAYGTRREQAFDAYITLLTQAPGIAGVIADLLLQNADFPTAGEAAARLRRMVPKQALGQGPSATETQQQQQIQQLSGLLQKALDDLAKAQISLKGKGEMRDIDAFDAETKRLAILAKLGIDEKNFQLLVAELMHDIAKTPLDMITAANAGDAEPAAPARVSNSTPILPEPRPPEPGARRAPDGQWYVRNPLTPGKWELVG